MADVVTSQTLFDKDNEAAFKFTNISDGGGESQVTKVDASTLKGADGDGSERLSIKYVAWDITTGNKEYVNILFDGGPAKTALILEGNGIWDLEKNQMKVPNNASNANGDILFTTSGFQTGDAYTIFLKLDKAEGYSYNND